MPSPASVTVPARTVEQQRAAIYNPDADSL